MVWPLGLHSALCAAGVAVSSQGETTVESADEPGYSFSLTQAKGYQIRKASKYKDRKNHLSAVATTMANKGKERTGRMGASTQKAL
jgi:hypothetical protein